MRKFFSFIATSAILLNTFYAPLTAIAQEITPSPAPTPEATSTPDPSPEISPLPTEDPTPIPSETPANLATPTVEPTVVPEETSTPAPTDQAIEPQDPESNHTTTSPPESSSPESSDTPIPTFTPVVTDQNAEVTTQVVVKELFPETVQENSIVKLITDKLDYAPTEIAIITGSGFTPGKTYSLTVSSTDDPATSTTVDVTASGDGEFTYEYQLDGNYRPNYSVEVKDGEDLVASTTFTDSDSGFLSPSSYTNNNNVVNPNGAYTSNDHYAVFDSRDDRVDYRDFGFSIPSGSTINGIEVSLEGNRDSLRTWDVSLSYDGGSHFTSFKSAGNTFGNSDSSTTVGANNDTWGRTWSSGNFSNSNFRVRLDATSNDGAGDVINLDLIQVKVTYTLFLNTPPTVTEGDSTSVTISKNGTPTAFSLTLHATDPDVGQTLTWSVSSAADHGTAVASGTGSSKSISYTPTSGYVGTDSFIVQVSDGNGGTDTITVNITIQETDIPNPTLSESCGIDVVLVVDTSTSIDNSELSTMKTALKSFVNTFIGTPTQMAIISFDDQAVLESDWTSNLGSLTSPGGVIEDIDGSGYTNWEDALYDSRNMFPNRAGVPDLIVFTTDGDPTVSNTDPNTNTSQPNQHYAPAVLQANLAKGANTRIITLGIGMTGTDSQNRLIGLSSADAFYSAATFDDLEDELQSLVVSLCGGTVTARKLVDGQPASGWNFTIDGNDYLTDINGYTKAVSVDPETYNIVETLQDGYSFTSASCSGATNNGSQGTNSVDGVQVGAFDIVSCIFNNHELPQTGSIKIIKNSVPDNGQDVSFSSLNDTLGSFTLDDDGNNGNTYKNYIVFDNLTQGTHQITESVPSGWDLTSISCVGGGQWAPNGSTLTVDVVPGEEVVCTFTNTKTGSISGTKFEDLNGNGIWDSHWENGNPVYDEPVLSGWEIYIDSNKDGDWDLGEPKTITDGSGNYSFTGLSGDDKRVREIGKTGWLQTSTDPQDQPVSNGNDWGNINFGNFQLGSISGIKYNDSNGNGTKDPGENGLSGWTIVLDKNNNQLFDAGDLSTTTDANGNYSFTNLTQGTYHGYSYTVMEIPQTGWSPVNPVNGIQYVQILSGTDATDINFGNIRDTGTLTIIKNAITNSNENFYFDTNAGFPGGDFELEDDGNIYNGGTPESGTFTLPVGSYWVDERNKSGWKLTDLQCNDDNGSINLETGKANINIDEKGESVTCTYTNTQLGSISGYKYEDKNSDEYWQWWFPYFEPALGNWRIFIDETEGNGLFDSTEANVLTNDWLWYIPFWTGYYQFSNLLPGEYSICEEGKDGWSNTTPLCQNVNLRPGEDEYLNFGNVRYGTVTVTKFNDENQNGQFDDNENTLNGWTINLDSNSLVTGENGQEQGQVIFTNVSQENHGLSENLKEGWRQTDIYCDRVDDGDFNVTAQSILPAATYLVYVPAGQNINCYIGNFEEKPGVSITKSNDKSDGIGAGQTITYTLTVTNTGNIPLNNISIQDFLPGGFTYVPGSTSGALATDPTIEGSTLTWSAIEMLGVGDSVTINYQVTSSSELANGIYTNFATCRASTKNINDIGFTTLVFDRELDSPYLECNTATSTVTIGSGLSYGGSLGGQVLGISTELPATGSPTWIIIASFAMIGAGIYLNINSKKERRKNEQN